MYKTTLIALIVAMVTAVGGAHAEVGHAHSCTESYPPDALAAGHQGQIDLAFTVTADGTIQDLRIQNSSGYPELDQAALTCARNWRYKPATQDGTPLAAPWRASVRFGFNGTFEHPALHQLWSDIVRCTRKSSVLDGLRNNFYGFTDLNLAFSRERFPDVTILGRSGDDTLDSKAMECARASSSLIDVARELNATNWVLSLNWQFIRHAETQ